jgi:hypothetical protein
MNMWKASKWKLWNLEEKLKKTLEDRKSSYAHEQAELSFWKCLYYQNQAQSQCNSQKNSKVIFLEIEKPIVKFIQNLKRPQITNAILNNADLNYTIEP